MWKLLKNIFITEIPKIEETNVDMKSLKIIGNLETLIGIEGLVELLEDDIVKIYDLDLYYSSPSELLIYDDGSFLSERTLMKCGVFFSTYENNIYYLLKQLNYKVKGNKLGSKQKDDICTLIEMFKFYLGDEHYEWV